MARIIKAEGTGGVRYKCSNCGNTLLISDETAKVVLPEKCGFCGEEIEQEVDDGEA